MAFETTMKRPTTLFWRTKIHEAFRSMLIMYGAGTI